MVTEFTDKKEISIVKQIFEKSGLSTLDGLDVEINTIKTDIDVLGVYKNVFLIVECGGGEADRSFGKKLKKTVTNLNELKNNFDEVIEVIKNSNNDFYNENKQSFDSHDKLICKIFVSFNKKTYDDVGKLDKNLSKAEDVFIWTKEEKMYFEKISECTFDHSKYEIFNFLKLNPEEVLDDENKDPIVYLAYGTKINPDLYTLSFVVPVREVLKRSSIKRLRDTSSEEGYQRLLDKNKLRKMRDFLLENENSFYPNNIICSLNKDTTVKEGTIEEITTIISEKAKKSLIKDKLKKNLFIVEIPKSFDVFEVIDGQHRLYSYAQTKYHLYDKNKSKRDIKNKEQDDNKIFKLANETEIIVNAVYSKGDEKWEPGKLFFDINTTQTNIKPDDIIDLEEKYYKDRPSSKSGILLKRLNTDGVLKGKIKTRFWEKDKIKRTSLISYSGLKDIFSENKKAYKVFYNVFENKNNKIKDFQDFCFIIINNYLYCLHKLILEKHKKIYSEIIDDVKMEKYYLSSSVYTGALIRLLRHFLSDETIIGDLNKAIKNGNTRANIRENNLKNDEIMDIFNKELKILVDNFNFTMIEFNQKSWSSNSWAIIEAELFYSIRIKKTEFGDENLISKKYRR